MRTISKLFAFFGKSLKFTLEIDGKVRTLLIKTEFCIFPRTTLTLKVAMLLINLIYPIVQDSG